MPLKPTVVMVRSKAPPDFSSLKLWMPERSDTTIRYRPGATLVTRWPFLVSVIVKPGPTVARSVVAFVRPPATAVSASAAPAAASAATIAMRVILTSLVVGTFSNGLTRALPSRIAGETQRGREAAGQGFEPQLLGPEPSVLPLDDPATGRAIVAGTLLASPCGPDPRRRRQPPVCRDALRDAERRRVRGCERFLGARRLESPGSGRIRPARARRADAGHER